jgi:hypothetical protein
MCVQPTQSHFPLGSKHHDLDINCTHGTTSDSMSLLRLPPCMQHSGHELNSIDILSVWSLGESGAVDFGGIGLGCMVYMMEIGSGVHSAGGHRRIGAGVHGASQFQGTWYR